jgi:methionyl-tRNA formyltransferase
MDAGPIVASEPLDVRPDDTAVTLEARAAVVAARLLRRALPEWLAGRLEARPQPTEGVTMTRPLRREDGRLDPGRSAVELERQVRAYQPWPGSFVDIGAVRIIVWSAHAAAAEPGDLPGRIVRTPDGGLALIAARGRLVFDVVRAAGRRSMSAAELVRGHPDLLARWSSS